MIALINGMPVIHDEDFAPLVCHGCAHSHGGAIPYPGEPSGERPCLFCTRNPNQEEREADLAIVRKGLTPGVAFTARYDNGPTRREPADQYISLDRLMRDVEEGSIVLT